MEACFKFSSHCYPDFLENQGWGYVHPVNTLPLSAAHPAHGGCRETLLTGQGRPGWGPLGWELGDREVSLREWGLVEDCTPHPQGPLLAPRGNVLPEAGSSRGRDLSYWPVGPAPCLALGGHANNTNDFQAFSVLGLCKHFTR